MATPESSDTQAFTPTADQWEQYEASLWQETAQIAEVRSTLQSDLDGMYSTLNGVVRDRLSYQDQQAYDQEVGRYWELHAQLGGVVARESSVFGVLEGIADGTAHIDDVLALLPPDKDDTDQSSQQSSRRSRDEAPDYETPVWWLLGIEPLTSDISRTDPRRLSTGRNRKRLVSGSGLDPMFAEAAFFDATADTHGGKSRRPGKNGGYYIGAGGRRINKH